MWHLVRSTNARCPACDHSQLHLPRRASDGTDIYVYTGRTTTASIPTSASSRQSSDDAIMEQTRGVVNPPPRPRIRYPPTQGLNCTSGFPDAHRSHTAVGGGGWGWGGGWGLGVGGWGGVLCVVGGVVGGGVLCVVLVVVGVCVGVCVSPSISL